MHIEVQVALNFVISYLYNKLPRRRVNLFGEELEKALKQKFQGHWYPEKPFKGSAFRCLKTGDPVDQVLERAARESGVPITDILEHVPAELSVWIDPGEVSYRIGEKGAVKILYSEHHDHFEDISLADREVTKTFNPEAQCFRPIDAVNNMMNGMNLSPKTSPLQATSPTTSSASPTFKSGHMNTSPNVAAGTFLPRTQAPVTFTTATFAQTKFGSTKLKTNSKRANSSYRMSPTEFANYIKQRAMQQQLHHSHLPNNHFGPIGPASPSRSLSPNPMGLGIQNDPFYFPTNLVGVYPPQFGSNNAGNIGVGGSGGVNGVNGGNINGSSIGSGVTGGNIGGGGGNGVVNGGTGGNVGANVSNGIGSVVGGPAVNNSIVQNGGTGQRNIFDSNHFHPDIGNNGLYGNNTNGINIGNISNGKYSGYIEPHGFYGQQLAQQTSASSQQQQQQHQQQQQQQQQQMQNGIGNNSSMIMGIGNNNNINSSNNTNNNNNNNNNNMGIISGVGNNLNNGQQISSPGSNQDTSKIIDGLNSFYSNTGPYQHLLVAN